MIVALLEHEPTADLVKALDRWVRRVPWLTPMTPPLEALRVRDLQRLVRRLKNEGIGQSIPVGQVLIGVTPDKHTVRGYAHDLLALGVVMALREGDDVRRCDDPACPYGREGPRWFVRRGKATNCSDQCRRRKANRTYYAKNFGTLPAGRQGTRKR